jgi:hypothetical protein
VDVGSSGGVLDFIAVLSVIALSVGNVKGRHDRRHSN